MFNCIKYSYKSGTARKRVISIKNDDVTYHGMWNTTAIDTDKIRGISYGPRTITFNMIKECTPWLIVSIITEDRTYDFEFKTLHYLKRFISAMHAINRRKNYTMVIPQLEHIDMDSLWMIFSCHINIPRSVTSIKWSDWLNTRSRKYKVIRSKSRTAVYDEHKGCCSICLDNYPDDEMVCELVCGHAFHIRCISEWFKRSFTCPLCRVSIS